MKTKSSWLFVVAAAFALTLQVGPASAVNLVNNGSFETGDFSGWTQVGNTTFNGVECPGAGFVAQGNCDAFFGPVGSTGGIQQLVNLIIGKQYFLTFAFQPDGGTPSSFTAMLGGVTLLSLTNPAAGPYTTFSFSVIATAATETLAFIGFRDDPGFLKLDAVSLSVPEPASMGLLAIGLAAMFMGLRRKV